MSRRITGTTSASCTRSRRWPRPTSRCSRSSGAHERLGDGGASERIAETAPRGELVVIEGAGHFPFAEAPDRYWPALISWLERTGSGA